MSGERRVRYEVVFDCRDRPIGERLCGHLEDLTEGVIVRRTDDGPTWTVTLDFESHRRALEFFGGEPYRQFCMDVRRSAQTSVLVVPLGPPDETG